MHMKVIYATVKLFIFDTKFIMVLPSVVGIVVGVVQCCCLVWASSDLGMYYTVIGCHTLL